MTAAGIQWLVMAILMVEAECIRSGRNPDRVRRLFANSPTQRDKGLRRVVSAMTAEEKKRAHKAVVL